MLCLNLKILFGPLFGTLVPNSYSLELRFSVVDFGQIVQEKKISTIYA